MKSPFKRRTSKGRPKKSPDTVLRPVSVQLRQKHINALDALAREEDCSISQLVRRAVNRMLKQIEHRRTSSKE